MRIVAPALDVGEGMRNREVAAALFATAKTVEYHLGHVYDKFGIRSRSELAKILATRDLPDALTGVAQSVNE